MTNQINIFYFIFQRAFITARIGNLLYSKKIHENGEDMKASTPINELNTYVIN